MNMNKKKAHVADKITYKPSSSDDVSSTYWNLANSSIFCKQCHLQPFLLPLHIWTIWNTNRKVYIEVKMKYEASIRPPVPEISNLGGFRPFPQNWAISDMHIFGVRAVNKFSMPYYHILKVSLYPENLQISVSYFPYYMNGNDGLSQWQKNVRLRKILRKYGFARHTLTVSGKTFVWGKGLLYHRVYFLVCQNHV